MKSGSGLTQKQRQAMEAAEGARREGVGLSEYARRRGLELRTLYDAIAALRRKGVLPKAGSKPGSAQKFVAVSVAGRAVPAVGPGAGVPLCRIVQRGVVIECLQWPDPRWMAGLMQTAGADAAP